MSLRPQVKNHRNIEDHFENQKKTRKEKKNGAGPN